MSAMKMNILSLCLKYCGMTQYHFKYHPLSPPLAMEMMQTTKPTRMETPITSESTKAGRALRNQIIVVYEQPDPLIQVEDKLRTKPSVNSSKGEHVASDYQEKAVPTNTQKPAPSSSTTEIVNLGAATKARTVKSSTLECVSSHSVQGNVSP